MDNGFVVEIQQQAVLRGWGFQPQSCRPILWLEASATADYASGRTKLRLLLAMSDFGSHASFFATDFSAAFTGF